MNTLATPFRTILKGLQAVIGIVLTKERHREPILTRIYLHLNRTLARFEKLVANWQNNTLPKQRHRPVRPDPARALCARRPPAPAPPPASPPAAPGSSATSTTTIFAATPASSSTSSPPPNASPSSPKSPAPAESSARWPDPSASRCPATRHRPPRNPPNPRQPPIPRPHRHRCGRNIRPSASATPSFQKPANPHRRRTPILLQ